MRILSKYYFSTYIYPYNYQSDRDVGLRGQKPPFCPLPAFGLKDKQIQSKITCFEILKLFMIGI